MNPEPLNLIVKDIKNYLLLEKESGMDEFMFKRQAKGKKESLLGEASPLQDKKSLLEELKERVYKCSDCALYKSRRNLVFGEGNQDASLMFVGEAPGLEEDIQGRPFVGQAGALLTKIIEAMGFKRGDVYIANVLKCRPPNNRPPLPSEIIACREFLIKQIDIIRPKVICCLGKFSAQTLLMSDEPISALRGKFLEFEGIKVMPTFHPAYLLRNPKDKKLVWEDMKKVRDYLKGDRPIFL
jgi:DNA polymerase